MFLHFVKWMTRNVLFHAFLNIKHFLCKIHSLWPAVDKFSKFKRWFLHFLTVLLLYKIDCCTEKLGVSNIYQRNHAHMDSANELSCCHGNCSTGWSSHGNTESVPTESRGHRSSCLHLSIWVKISLFLIYLMRISYLIFYWI